MSQMMSPSGSRSRSKRTTVSIPVGLECHVMTAITVAPLVQISMVLRAYWTVSGMHSCRRSAQFSSVYLRNSASFDMLQYLIRRHKMTELRKLVERYVSGEVQFPEFRRAFVMDFLAVASQEPATWSVVLRIESECDDFAQGIITESQLKSNISVKKDSSSSAFLCRAIQQPFVPPTIVTGSSTDLVPVSGRAAGQLAGVTLSWAHA